MGLRLRLLLLLPLYRAGSRLLRLLLQLLLLLLLKVLLMPPTLLESLLDVLLGLRQLVDVACNAVGHS